MRNRFGFAALVLILAATSVISSCGLLRRTATPTFAVAVTQGQVRDALTKLPVAGARVQSGPVTVLSDVEGTFSISTVGGDMIRITAPGHETIQLTPQPGLPLVVDLVPDAPTTLALIHDYEQRHEFGREYDLLYPDVQALFTRDEFIHYMETERPYDILEFSMGSVQMLASGTIVGKSYDDVAQVPVEATVLVEGERMRKSWLAHAVKAEGLWRGFRGPLISPTAARTATSTPAPTTTPSPQPTYTATHGPPPTLTATPTPSASTTPYYTVIAPDHHAMVTADFTHLLTGPGEQYPAAWTVAGGTMVLILDWPHWVEGVPWYPVRDVSLHYSGWCSGAYLAAVTLPPTPTYTPQTPTPTHTPHTPTPTHTPDAPTPPIAQHIAFTSERDGNYEVYTIRPDGTDLRNLSRHSAQDTGATWAPTRDRLAFVSDRTGNNDIFVMKADGSSPQQITSGLAEDIHPAWSPNGALIAYVSNEDGDWEIFVMSANGTGVVQLTHNESWDSYPSWSSDSQKLVFTSDRDGNYELHLYDLATHAETRLTNHPASDAFPAWAPWGDEIAFTSARDGQLELYLLNLASEPHTVTRLTHTTPVAAANRYPSWSGDGQWLAFTSWRDGNAEVYTMHRSAWPLINLTNHPAADESPAWCD